MAGPGHMPPDSVSRDPCPSTRPRGLQTYSLLDQRQRMRGQVVRRARSQAADALNAANDADYGRDGRARHAKGSGALERIREEELDLRARGGSASVRVHGGEASPMRGIEQPDRAG
jgi:hypothetical protein